MSSRTQGEKRHVREIRNAERAETRSREQAERKKKFVMLYGKSSSHGDGSDDDDDKLFSCERDSSMHRKAWQQRFSVFGERQRFIVPTQPTASSFARLVMNHSTHCDGIVPVLRCLTHKLDNRFTIIPGIISQSQNGHSSILTIDMQRSDEDICINLIAKKGGTVQTIMIQKPLDYDAQKLFCLVQESLEHIHVPTDRPTDCPSNRDRAAAATKQEHDERCERGHEQRLQEMQAHRDERKAASVRKHMKKLIQKVGRAAAEKHAERDVNIVMGEARTRNSRV